MVLCSRGVRLLWSKERRWRRAAGGAIGDGAGEFAGLGRILCGVTDVEVLVLSPAAPPSRNHKEGQASEVSQPGSGDATEVSQPGSYAADIEAANSFDVSRKNKEGGHASEVPHLDSHAVDVGAAKTRLETSRETRQETRLEARLEAVDVEAVRLSSSMQFVGEEGHALEQGEQAEEARRQEQQAQAQKLREEMQREQKLREEAGGVGASLPPAASGARPCVCMSACCHSCHSC